MTEAKSYEDFKTMLAKLEEDRKNDPVPHRPSLSDVLALMPKGATLFRDRDFQGPSQLYKEGAYDGGDLKGYEAGWSEMLEYSIDDAVSSVRLDPGYQVTLYADRKFSGASKTFTASAEYVGDDWQDRASSIVVATI